MKIGSWSPSKNYVNRGDSLVYSSATDILIGGGEGETARSNFSTGNVACKIRSLLFLDPLLKLMFGRYFDKTTWIIEPRFQTTKAQQTCDKYSNKVAYLGDPLKVLNGPELKLTTSKVMIAYDQMGNAPSAKFNQVPPTPKLWSGVDSVIYETQTLYLGSKMVTKLWGYTHTKHYVAALLSEYFDRKKFMGDGRSALACQSSETTTLKITESGMFITFPKSFKDSNQPKNGSSTSNGRQAQGFVGDYAKSGGVFQANYEVRWTELWNQSLQKGSSQLLKRDPDMAIRSSGEGSKSSSHPSVSMDSKNLSLENNGSMPSIAPVGIDSNEICLENKRTKATTFLSVESISYALQDVREPKVFALICLDHLQRGTCFEGSPVVSVHLPTAHCHAFLCPDALVCRNLVLALHKVIDEHRLDRAEAGSTMAYHADPRDCESSQENYYGISKSLNFDGNMMEHSNGNGMVCNGGGAGAGTGIRYPREVEIR